MKPLSEYDANMHSACVYLAEAKRRRGQAFSWTLLQWAANARKRAVAAKEAARPAQSDLFGSAA